MKENFFPLISISWKFQDYNLSPLQNYRKILTLFHPYKDGDVNLNLKIFITICLYKMHEEVEENFTILFLFTTLTTFLNP